MSKQYWLHRIAHEWEASYPLLDQGYLTYGWSCFMHTDLVERVRAEGEQGFRHFMEETGETSRSRWSLWNFLQIQRGDLIVVPLFDGMFTVVEAEEEAHAISDLGLNFLTRYGVQASVDAGGVYDADGRIFDLGYTIKVHRLTEQNIPRSYAEAPLVSRMKLRQATVNINAVGNNVEAALLAKGPIQLHDRLVDAVTPEIKKVISQVVTPDNLESIVRWYMKKKGATRVWSPAKNQPGKENGADADVIAEFEDLGIIFYIQVKDHQGLTSEWAVQQIYEYTNQKQDDSNDYVYVPWAITTAEFTETAIQKGKAAGVRLIGGNEFVRMILDCGVDDIDSALA